jgi:hypothetical protein
MNFKRPVFLGMICILSVVFVPRPDVGGSIEPQSVAAANSSHPRLFFTVHDVSRLQQQAVTTHQEIWQPIREYAASQFDTSPPLEPPDGGVTTYRNYANMLIPFAFACVVAEDADYCTLAKRYLLTYAAWDRWDIDEQRDLGHGHMLLANALAYDWLYPELTPSQRQAVRETLRERAHEMYEASSGPYRYAWNNWWRRSYLQNHFSVNHSALGMAGLALLGEDDRAQLWVDQAGQRFARLQYLLDGMEDGSWHEGINYQNYALTLWLPFAFNIRMIQNLDLFPDAYLESYPYWRIYNHLPNSTDFILSYGDFEWSWENGYRPQNVLRFIAREYGNGHAEWMAQQLIVSDPRRPSVWKSPWYVFEFFYYDPSVRALSLAGTEKARVFADLESVIWRTGWGEDDLVFGLKTGASGGRLAFDTFVHEVYPWEPPCAEMGCELNIGHAHDDANAFYLYQAGSWLAPESEGVGKTATAFHNTLLIDGRGQYRASDYKDPDDFVGSDGFLKSSANTTCFDYVAADATRRYKNVAGMQDVSRHVTFVRPDYLVIVDNLAADAPHQYEWINHFGRSVSIEGDWVRGEAAYGRVLGVGIVAPQSYGTATGNDGRPYVRIRPASQAADVRFVNVLWPTTVGAWPEKPAIMLLDDTGSAVAIQVRRAGGSIREDILATYVPATSTMVIGSYQYDARAAIVAHDARGDLTKLFVYGGTTLRDQANSRVLVENLDPSVPFEAVYYDRTVVMNGDILTEVTLYAPQVEVVAANGQLVSFQRSGDWITFDGSELGIPQTPVANLCTAPVEVEQSVYIPIVSRSTVGYLGTR